MIETNGRKRVLVFPGGTEIGLEYHRSLCRFRRVKLYGAASVATDHGAFVYQRYSTEVPFVDTPGFISEFNNLAGRWQIDNVVPAHDSAALALSEAAGDIDALVLTSPVETWRVCRSKRMTYKRFKGVVRTPRVFGRLSDAETWPVFMKPDVGQGSGGARMVKTAAEAEFFLEREPDLLVLEYLGGAEFTVDCFTDRFGSLLFAGPRERVMTSRGISTNTRAARNDLLVRMAERINDEIRFRGAWFFQAREDRQGQPALLEIGPRLAGGAGLWRNMGVNLPLLSLYDAWGEDVRIARNEGGLEMDRSLRNRFRSSLSYNHVYVDLDDCLILDDRVNTQLAAFLFQCLNRGVGLHLLTRHSRNPRDTLRRFRLERLFDSVEHVPGGQAKSDRIAHRDSILIDDSFAEREEVRSTLGIPVFAPDAVESLITDCAGGREL